MGENVSTQPALPTRVLKIAVLLLVIIFLVEVVILFSTDRYDWDLDHEMYFGQRLLSGDLIWTHEFHDKLPFLQLLFAVPAWFESIQVWRLMSLISCLFAALSIPYLLPRIFSFPRMSKSSLNNLLIFISTLYLALCISTPAGLTHINPMATSFALIATLLMMYSLASDRSSESTIFIVVLMGGFFAAAAISIRPYFIAPLVFTVVLGALYPLFSGQLITRRHYTIVLCWGGAVVTWGLVLNLLPYLVTGHIDAFVAGLQILQQKLTPTPPFLEASNGYLKIVFFLMIGITALLVIGYRPKSSTTPFLVFTITTAAILFGFTIQKHWWSHYIQFFYGYFSLIILFLIAWIFEGRVRFQHLVTPIVFGFLVILIIGLLQSTARKAYTSVMQSSESAHRVANILEAFQNYRSKEDRSDLTFLAPHLMYLHWQLKEPRHDFPHAANTRQIFRGWWENIEPSSIIQTPKNKEKYCDFLFAKGPEIVVAISGSPVTTCFDGEAKHYRVKAEYRIDGKKETFLIFRRN